MHDRNNGFSGAGAVLEAARRCGTDGARSTYVTPMKYHTLGASGSQRTT